MTRIICDTMIWYGLSKYQLQIPDPSKYTLVCTYLSLMELAFSPNNLKKIEEVQAAIQVIIQLKPEIILRYPWNHALILFEEEFDREVEIEEDLTLEFIRFLHNYPKEELMSDSFKDHLEEISSTRRENFEESADFLSKLFGLNNEVKRILKRYSDDNSFLLIVKNWLLHNLNERELKTYSLDSIPWDQFEFYTTIGAYYMRTMMLSRRKADGNDENDLTNMIYVQPGDKYWTLEKKWLNLAREAKMTKFLYEPNA